MDWRRLGELLEAGQQTYGEMLDLAVWVKSNAGQGSYYRSQHELIGVFRAGEAPHLNNIKPPPRPLALERLALRRREELPGRPDG